MAFMHFLRRKKGYRFIWKAAYVGSFAYFRTYFRENKTSGKVIRFQEIFAKCIGAALRSYKMSTGRTIALQFKARHSSVTTHGSTLLPYAIACTYWLAVPNSLLCPIYWHAAKIYKLLWASSTWHFIPFCFGLALMRKRNFISFCFGCFKIRVENIAFPNGEQCGFFACKYYIICTIAKSKIYRW